MTQPNAPYLLDLHDGRPPIPCRDEWQARWLEGTWHAWCTGVASELGLRENCPERIGDLPRRAPAEEVSPKTAT
jgi:hypothetical protein